DDDVPALFAVAGHNDWLFVLLGGHDRHVATTAQAAEQGLIGENVEFLHGFTLDVLLPRRAEHVRQPSAAHARLDHLRGQRKTRQQPGEFARGMGVVATLLLQDVLLHCHHGRRFHGLALSGLSGTGTWTYSSRLSIFAATANSLSPARS